MEGFKLLFCTLMVLLLPVAAAHSSTVEMSPIWLRSYAENKFYITVKNSPASADPISEVYLINPNNLSVGCGAVPAGWDLASPFGEAECAYATATARIEPGSEQEFYFFATIPSDSGTAQWGVKTKGGDEKYHDFQIKVDAEEPSKPVLTAPRLLAFKQREEVEFGFSAEDNLGGSGVEYCQVSIDLKVVGNLQASGSGCKGSLILPTMDEGEHIIYVEVFDRAGNSATSDFKMIVDNSPPKISSTSVMDAEALVGGYFVPGKQVKVLAKISDDGSGFDASTVSADLAGITRAETDTAVAPERCDAVSCEWTVFASEGLSGSISVRVTAADKVGNSNSASSSAVADSEKPVITMEFPEEGSASPMSETKIAFSIYDTESKASPQSIKVAIDGENIAQFTPDKFCRQDGDYYRCDFSISGYLSDGRHTLSVTAKDRAGNPAEPKQTSWVVDKDPPVIYDAFLKYDPFLNPLGLTMVAKAYDKGTGIRSLFASSGDAEVPLQKQGDYWKAPLPSDFQRGGKATIFFTTLDMAGNTGTRSSEQNIALSFISWLCLYVLYLFVIARLLIALKRKLSAKGKKVYLYGQKPIHHRVAEAAHGAVHRIKGKLHRPKYQYHPKK